MLGVDIKPCGIRWVQLSHKRHAYELHKAILTEPVKDCFEEGKVKHWGKLSSVLARDVEQFGVKGLATAICLPAPMVRLQRLLLPEGLTAEEKEVEILSRLQRDLPGLSEALCLDFICFKTRQAEQIEVLTAVARKEYVTSLVDCVNAAGLKVKVVDVDICALQRVSAFVSDSVLNLYFSAGTATLIILEQKECLHHRQWLVGSMEQLVSDIQRYVNALSLVNSQNLAIYASDEFIQQFHPLWEQTSTLVPIYPDIFLQLNRREQVELNFMQTNPADFFIACGLAMRKVPLW